MKEAIEKIVKALVDDVEAVEIGERAGDGGTGAAIISVRVAESDMGKLIGREGRTVRAIRSLLFVASQKHRKRFILEIAE